MRRVWRRAAKIALWSVASLLALLVAVLIAASIILTPAKVTEMANRYANQYLNADVTIGNVSIKLLRSLPNLCVKIENGTLLSKALKGLPDSLQRNIPAKADSLLQFKELYLALNLPDALLGKITIKRIMTSGLKAYAYVAPGGKGNWEIFEGGASESAGEEERENEEQSGEFRLDIKEIEVSNGISLALCSAPDSLSAALTLGQLFIRGNLSNMPERIYLKRWEIDAMEAALEIGKAQQNSLTTRLNLDTLKISSERGRGTSVKIATRSTLAMNGKSWLKGFPIGIRGNISAEDMERHALRLSNIHLYLGEIPIKMEGRINITNNAIEIPQISGQSNKVDIGYLLSKIPKSLFPSLKELHTDAVLQIGVQVSGKYDFATGSLPAIAVTAKVPSCSASFNAMGVKINNISAEIEADYKPEAPQKSSITLKHITASGKALELEGECRVEDYLNDPKIKLNLRAFANADTISRILPPDFPAKVKGKATAEIKLDSPLSNLTDMKRLGNAESSIEVKSGFVEVLVPQQEIECRLLNASLSAGTGKMAVGREKNRTEQMIRFSVAADSTYMQYGSKMEVIGRGLKASALNSAKVLDNQAKEIVPLVVKVEGERLAVKSLEGDAMSIRLRNSVNTLAIMPDREHKRNPRFRLVSTNGMLRLKDRNGIYAVRDAKLAIRAKLDLMAGAARSGERDLTNLIRDLSIEGNLKADRGRIVTPLLPLKISMSNADISFNSDSVNLNNTSLRIGQSQLRSNGYLSGLRGALINDTTLTADMDIVADTLNLNQLLAAVEKGQQYIADSHLYRDSLAAMDNEDELEQRLSSMVEGDELPQERTLFMLPDNLKARLDIELNHAMYARTIFEKMSCSVRIMESCLQLKDFRAASSSGNIGLSAFYATKSKEDIAAGIDMDLKSIRVEDFIDMIPSVDTLLPMLKSFAGKIDSQIAFSTKMDSQLNMDPLSMQGSLRIKGDSLVLMDGETFAMIAKKARFKNRDRNLVDSVSVEALIHDGFIELFPFLMTMDRYCAAISGRQNIDMSYKYHISVLKSIIPFRFGINIRGDKDKMRFGIGRAKYKSAKLPVYSFIIDNAKMNLRDFISRIYNKGVEIALSSPIDKKQLLGQVQSVENNAVQSRLVDDFGDEITAAPLSKRDSLFMAEPDSVLLQMDNLSAREQDSLLLQIKYRQAMESHNTALGTLSASKANAIRKSMRKVGSR